jgi:hypothetical protein
MTPWDKQPGHRAQQRTRKSPILAPTDRYCFLPYNSTPIWWHPFIRDGGPYHESAAPSHAPMKRSPKGLVHAPRRSVRRLDDRPSHLQQGERVANARGKRRQLGVYSAGKKPRRGCLASDARGPFLDRPFPLRRDRSKAAGCAIEKWRQGTLCLCCRRVYRVSFIRCPLTSRQR